MAETSFQYPLYSIINEREDGFRVQNSKGEVHREHIIDEVSSSLTVQANLLRVEHGKMRDTLLPATILVIEFHFFGGDKRRRFHEIQVKIRFEDENKTITKDPEVVQLWPNGDFTLSEKSVSVEETTRLGANIKGGAGGLLAGLKTTWERRQNSDKTDRACLVGMKRIEGRNYGKPNAVSLRLYDIEHGSGVVSELRTAILLRRHDAYSKFLAHVEVNAKVDWMFTLRKILGSSPLIDPVIFDPSVKSFNPRASPIYDIPILENELNIEMLRPLGNVLSTTTIRTRVEDTGVEDTGVEDTGVEDTGEEDTQEEVTQEEDTQEEVTQEEDTQEEDTQGEDT